MSARAARRSLVPWMFVAGFAIVLAVNGTMISIAVGSFSGLYADKPRQRGVAFNRVIAEQERRDSLGWKIETAWIADERRLEVRAVDRDGRPLPSATATAELVRPVERRAPSPVALVPRAPGVWTASVDLPARGVWDLDLAIESGAERYAATRRMFLQ